MGKKIETEMAPAAIGPYSQAVVVGNLVFTSGQIPLSPATGALVGDTVPEQTEAVIQNLQGILHAAGGSLDSVVKTTCFLTDMGAFGAFNEVYAKHFTSTPARSCVEVSALPRGAMVEIEAIAEIV